MKKLLPILLFAAMPFLLAETLPLPLVPKPLKAEAGQGHFGITKDTRIYYSGKLKKEAELLAEGIRKLAGLRFPVSDFDILPSGEKPGGIQLRLGGDAGSPEAYRCIVSPGSVRITGATPAGLFRGTQTLLQLIAANAGKPIPCLRIKDSPRFRWRGLHLDVGRHFFPIEDIKKLINWMAFHRMNTFHWHLTEDQGWRIEIKKYPKLTEIGAWRESSPPYGNRGGSDGKRYGGFYTQEQIKDLVAYAAARHITIVPEIDMPGHMASAIAAYPGLGCDDIPGYAPKVMTRWGVHPYVLAPKEETFRFIEDVLSEICLLFPSQYIHIGGDEAPKGQWKKSKFAQSVIKREGLKDEHELQSYFIKRVEKILESKGRKLIGWDEIREGGLSPNASVMCWRGTGLSAAVASAKEGHDVVMAPNSHTYLDRYQAPRKQEMAKGKEFEAIGGFLPLHRLYNFEPVPAQLDEKTRKHILGVQAQLWTEYMHDWKKVEYMAFPRIAAIAELGWTQPGLKDYRDFRKRLAPILKLYKTEGVNAAEPYDPPPPTKSKTQ